MLSCAAWYAQFEKKNYSSLLLYNSSPWQSWGRSRSRSRKMQLTQTFIGFVLVGVEMGFSWNRQVGKGGRSDHLSWNVKNALNGGSQLEMEANGPKESQTYFKITFVNRWRRNSRKKISRWSFLLVRCDPELILRFFFFPLPFLPAFLLSDLFLPLISAPTGSHDCGLVTRWAQLLITSSYYLPSTPKDWSTIRAELTE